jgi:Concanavalin A-like lectin/glucanases superfamily
MAISRGPKLVTNGLSLYLDAANSSSYSGTGSTWYDVSGNNRNATLFNTPTYSTTNAGIFTFDDTSFEYATVPNIGSLTNFTIDTWARTNKSLTGKVTTIVTNQYDLVSNLNYSLGTNNSPSSYNMTFGFFNGAWRNVTGFSMAVNTWYHLTGTYDGNTVSLYVNGVINTTLSYTGTAASGGEIRIARRWDDVANVASNFFSGDISQVRIYNRSLNSTEILQNYNATKSRFGL